MIARVSLKGKLLVDVRIARISTVPFFVVTQLTSQLTAMVDQGAQGKVVTSNGPELSQLKKIPSLVPIPLEIPRFISPWRDLIALLKLWWIFKKGRIVIAHSTTPKAGLLTAVAAFMAGVPVRMHTFTGQPWVNMGGVKGWLARKSDWLIGQLSTCCYADSASQCKFLINQGVLNEGRVHVIGDGSLSGVDLKRFDRNRFSIERRNALKQSLDIPLDAEVLLFVGRITVEKGIRELLEAFVELKKNGSLAHLILVGPFDLDSGAGGAFSRDDMAIVRGLHFVGYTDTPEQYMAIADIFCLPSYREGFGTTVIESAAMGLPTVGSNICGLVDAVVDKETGILVKPRDAQALHAALKKLLSNTALRLLMGEAAKKRANSQFDERMINNLMIQEYHRHLQAKNLG